MIGDVKNAVDTWQSIHILFIVYCNWLFIYRTNLDSAENMSGLLVYRNLAPKAKNLIVAGGLSGFVFGVYFYTMRAVGGSDELQVAIDKFEEQKNKEEESATPAKA